MAPLIGRSSTVLPHVDPHAGHTPVMGVSYMVRGRTRTECQAAIDELCRLLGIVVTTPPTDRIGPGWVARAVAPPADAPKSTSH